MFGTWLRSGPVHSGLECVSLVREVVEVWTQLAADEGTLTGF